MKTALFIAKRYLFAKKSHHVINIISMISVVGVMAGTAGLIIVLSVFNGFSGLVLSLYNSFDPDIRITAVEGKTFDPVLLNSDQLKDLPEIRAISYTLSENALVKYSDRQYISTIKGVDTNFNHVSEVDSFIVDGEYSLQQGTSPLAVIGSGIAYALSVSVGDPFGIMSVYVPRKGKPVALTSPEDAFNVMAIRPSGVFSIQQDFDSKYVIVPLSFAREMTDHPVNISAAEIALKPGIDESEAKNKIASILDPGLKAQTRLEQHEFLYRILQSEKWAIYLILSFILIIAIFNITGSLTMLIIDKKKDIITLHAMGANQQLIRKIFLIEGIMITVTGALGGMLLGGIICFLQQEFGLVKIDDGQSFIVEAYPVVMEFTDFLLTFGIVAVIGLGASWYASSKAAGADLRHIRMT